MATCRMLFLVNNAALVMRVASPTLRLQSYAIMTFEDEIEGCKKDRFGLFSAYLDVMTAKEATKKLEAFIAKNSMPTF